MLEAQLETLSFVTPQLVGIADDKCGGDDWSAALAALARVDASPSPVDKIGCIVKCCAHLGRLVDPCDSSFVRLLALAVLRGQPARLHSQLEYIGRCMPPNRLWSPELGGPFTIARAAVQYLAHLDPVALTGGGGGGRGWGGASSMLS